MKRIALFFSLLAGMASSSFAQLWEPSANVQVQARMDYQYDWQEGHTLDNLSGFKGRYLNLMITGDINKHFSYAFRQRLNKRNSDDSSIFAATDFINLTYRPDDNWDFSAGKQVVAIGGYEYDKAPINVMSASEFWNNIPCYEFGVQIGYTLKNGKDRFAFQVSENPFRFQCGNNNTYAYNLAWQGNHGWYQSLWSVNMIEYRKGHFINYISLGNRFQVENWQLDLDFLNRASSHQTFFFKDCTVVAELSYSWKKWRVFGNYSYDVNKSGTDADWTVLNGTEMSSYAAGFEFHPLLTNRNDLRLHAYYKFTHGTNSNPDGALLNNNNLLNVGVTWMFDVFRYKK